MDPLQTLNLLLKTCRDGEAGFLLCAAGLRSSDLREVMNRRADECARAVEELKIMIGRHGGTPADATSLPGDVHRGWLIAKGALTGRDDHTILVECERGEDVALRDYRTAVEQDLPPDVRHAIEQQLAGVRRNHDQIRSLRDAVGEGWSAETAVHDSNWLRHAPVPADGRATGGRVFHWALAQARVHPVRSMGIVAILGLIGWRALSRNPTLDRWTRRHR